MLIINEFNSNFYTLLYEYRHRTRFGQDLPRVLKHTSAAASHQDSAPQPLPVMSHVMNETSYEQRYYYTSDPVRLDLFDGHIILCRKFIDNIIFSFYRQII